MSMLANYAVKVNNGSGCLFKVHSDEFMYVLTAKHVVEDADSLEIIRQVINDDGSLEVQILEVIGKPFFHNDKQKDAAIIKIKPVVGLKSISRVDKINIDTEKYTLIGHPNSRKGNNYSYREDELIMKNIVEYGYIEGELNKTCTYDEIVGQSGGGIIKGKNGKYTLMGIQKKMSVADKKETLSRIDFMPLSFYDDIVNQNAKDLKEILPAYLECFSNLKQQVILLDGCFVEAHVTFTRLYLRNVTDKIVLNNITPSFIKNFFQERLLIHNQHKDVLNDKSLWLSWLEFLIIMNVCQQTVIDNKSLEEIFNSHRLLFSSTEEDWSYELENIVKSDFRGLQKNSKVIVSTVSAPAMEKIPKGWVPDIMRTHKITTAELMIDSPLTYPLQDFDLIHINAFQKSCVIRKADQYKDYTLLTELELLEKLKTEYELLFAGE